MFSHPLPHMVLILSILLFIMLSVYHNPYNLTVEQQWQQNKNVSIHYYVYGLVRCHHNATDWTIHGLWPQNNATFWPEYCRRDTPFNITAIEALLPKLRRYWMACDVGKDYEFWEHEWLKHGTCCSMQQVDYFNTTLRLYLKYYDTFFRYICEGDEYECNVSIPSVMLAY